MKKLAMFLCLLMVVFIAPTNVWAGGGNEAEFCIEGCNYFFGFGMFSDEDSVADNSVLRITGYNGSKLIDINNAPVPPQGFYLYEIMQATELPTDYFNWEPHKNEYIPIDNKDTTDWYFFDSNKTVDIRVSKNGSEATPISFSDQQPIVVDGRTLLPIRAIAEYYDWDVTWDEEQKKVLVENDTKMLQFYINVGGSEHLKSSVMPIWDKISMDVPPMILNGKTLLPIRAVAEALGLQVEWLSTENAVLLTEQ